MANIKQTIEKILEYMWEENRDFWENCSCSDEIMNSDDIDKCVCEENKEHIFRRVVKLDNWLTSPSCPLVDVEEGIESEESKFDGKFR